MALGTGGMFTQEMLDKIRETMQSGKGFEGLKGQTFKAKVKPSTMGKVVFVAISESGGPVFVAQGEIIRDDAMELKGLRHICDQVDQRIRLRHKQLVISPETMSNPEEFKYRRDQWSL